MGLAQRLITQDTEDVSLADWLPGVVLTIRRPSTAQLIAWMQATPAQAGDVQRALHMLDCYAGLARDAGGRQVPGIVAGWSGVTYGLLGELADADISDVDPAAPAPPTADNVAMFLRACLAMRVEVITAITQAVARLQDEHGKKKASSSVT